MTTIRSQLDKARWKPNTYLAVAGQLNLNKNTMNIWSVCWQDSTEPIEYWRESINRQGSTYDFVAVVVVDPAGRIVWSWDRERGFIV